MFCRGLLYHDDFSLIDYTEVLNRKANLSKIPVKNKIELAEFYWRMINFYIGALHRIGNLNGMLAVLEGYLNERNNL